MDVDTNELLSQIREIVGRLQDKDQEEESPILYRLTRDEFGLMLKFSQLDEQLSTADNPGYLPDDWACALNPTAIEWIE